MVRILQDSFAVCPFGFLEGFDGDGQRACQTSDGRVFSYLTGQLSQDIPQEMRIKAGEFPMALRRLLADLISSLREDEPTFALCQIETPKDRQITAYVGGMLNDSTRIALRRPPHGFETIEINYSGNCKAVAETGFKPGNLDLLLARKLQMPWSVSFAAEKLVKHGYSLLSIANEGTRMPSLVFCKEGGSESGVRVAVSWIVG